MAKNQINNGISVTSIITNAESITPHDTNAAVFDRLWVGGAGDIAIRLSDMTSGSIIFKNVPVGFFPVSVSLVLSTGTTATDILGLT